MRPTRFYSNRQEKKIAKAVSGKQVAGSGATKFNKGDVITKDWFIEAKTSVTEKQSFSIKREWIDKMREQAFQMGKHLSALVFDFGTDERFYVIDEKTFLMLKEENNG